MNTERMAPFGFTTVLPVLWGSGGTGDSLSDLYLSKVIADTAADVISFDAGAQLKNLTNAPALATDADGTIIAATAGDESLVGRKILETFLPKR